MPAAPRHHTVTSRKPALPTRITNDTCLAPATSRKDVGTSSPFPKAPYFRVVALILFRNRVPPMVQLQPRVSEVHGPAPMWMCGLDARKRAVAPARQGKNKASPGLLGPSSTWAYGRQATSMRRGRPWQTAARPSCALDGDSEAVALLERCCAMARDLQSVDHRNSAYVYLRISLTQGLGRDLQGQGLVRPDSHRIRSAWWTLYIFDRTFSSGGGRQLAPRLRRNRAAAGPSPVDSGGHCARLARPAVEARRQGYRQ
ncbi:hypothetical protein VTK73DRAFT_1817 [Phialemonium thermophilum]|uniref:Transcription factor domain-containing protein n=1 Tax=Phialemonium thermophilum TaxID=223376 RepID=A0ABR3VSZ4_9PEZI